MPLSDLAELEEHEPPPGKPLGHKRFYTQEALGEKQALTPDGYLVCHDVALARIGSQVYGEHELPGMRGKDGLVTIQRDANQVFRPETIASFNGKPVTNDHPSEKVTPGNHKQYAVGVVLNPHQGDGINFDNNFLYADLLITDPQAIADIRSGKREVSAGYDAEYEQTGDGQGRQYDIVGNHVALVNRGRCGPLCSIGDEEMSTRVRVNDGRRRSIRDALLGAFRSRDESAFHDQLEELAKVPELLGEQVSGESSGGEGHTGDTHVSINLGGGSSSPSVTSGGGIGDEPDPDAGSSGSPPTGDPSGSIAPQWAQDLIQRMARMEQAIVMLAQGDDGDDGNGDDPANGGEDPDNNGDGRSFGDRRRTRDRRSRDEEAPTAPPTDEPNEDPAQSLPYGAGTIEKQFESPQMGTEDKRRTKDGRRMTGDQQGTRQHFVGDSTSLRTEFQETMSRAELLASGITLPTFDGARSAQTTHDAMCSVRRNALTAAYRDQSKHGYIDALLGGKNANFGQMSCDRVADVFNGASELVRQANNHEFGRVRPNNQGVRGNGRAPTPAEINAKWRAKYPVN